MTHPSAIMVTAGGLIDEPPAFEIKATFTSGEGLTAWLDRGGETEVAFVELPSRAASAIVIIALLRERLPTIKCLAVMDRLDAEEGLAAIRAGADGILPRSMIRSLVGSLRRAASRHGPKVPLTDREADVLTFLAKGVRYANIASLLGIRLGTVQNHIKRLYAKLEINTKAEAAVVAMDLGLV